VGPGRQLVGPTVAAARHGDIEVEGVDGEPGLRDGDRPAGASDREIQGGVAAGAGITAPPPPAGLRELRLDRGGGGGRCARRGTDVVRRADQDGATVEDPGDGADRHLAPRAPLEGRLGPTGITAHDGSRVQSLEHLVGEPLPAQLGVTGLLDAGLQFSHLIGELGEELGT